VILPAIELNLRWLISTGGFLHSKNSVPTNLFTLERSIKAVIDGDIKS
jgi:hypothetical protein